MMMTKINSVIVLLLVLLSACGGTNHDATALPPQSLASTTIVATEYKTIVQQLYVSYFGRPADTGGLGNFQTQLAALRGPTDIQGLDQAYHANSAIKSLVDSFGLSAESSALYSGDNTAFVTAIYKNILNRTPDPAGLAFWVGALDGGGVTRANASLSIMAGALINSSSQGKLDASLVNRKVTVGVNFTDALMVAPANGYSGNAAAALARDMLASVTATTDTAAFQATVAALVSKLATLTPSAPLAPKATSYANAKAWNLGRIAFPASSQIGSGGPLAWGLGDFSQSGTIDLFTANQNYDPSSVSEAAAKIDARYLSDFDMWHRSADGSYTRFFSVKGCLHPRKAVVADFNNDGVPDVFVACHGYDAAPFPGEKSKLLLSDGKGGFKLTDATADTGFFHGAAAADLNGDGYPDLIVANSTRSPNLYALINQKDGSFAVDTTRIISPSIGYAGPYFSVELVDVNGDGVIDLLAGGHEQSGSAPTKIFMGNAAGQFGANGKVVTIPPVPGRGVVLDFTLVTNAGKTGIFVNRTSDETSAEGFYGTRTMQWVDLSSLQSTLLLDVKAEWVPWWIPSTQNGQNGVQPYYNRANYFLVK